MKEKLQEYALVAEIVGGIAIVASLLFVGFQIQQNNSITKASSYQSFVAEINNWRSDIITDPYLRRIFYIYTSGEGVSNLSQEEQLSLVLLSGNFFSMAESAYYSRQYGLLGNSEWERILFGICINFNNAQKNNILTQYISDEFKAYMEINCGD